MFQFSFDFDSSVKLFSVEFWVEFSFSCLTLQNFSSRLSFNFTFISWEAPCLFKIFIGYSRSEQKNLSAGYFFCLSVWSPNSSFHLILVLFLGKLLAFTVWNTYWQFKKWVMKPFNWLYFPSFSLVLEFVQTVPIVVFDKYWEVAFWCRIVWDYFSLFHTG